MFGIGMPEMLMILAIALIVIGPKKLPDLARSIGRALGEFKRATSDIKESIQRETGLGDVKESLDEIGKEIKESVDLKSDLIDEVDGKSDAVTTDHTANLDKVRTAFDQLNDKDGSDRQAQTGQESSDPEGNTSEVKND